VPYGAAQHRTAPHVDAFTPDALPYALQRCRAAQQYRVPLGTARHRIRREQTLRPGHTAFRVLTASR